ncbi:hypothetical protein RchiOBHm_Chr5g0037661 [Rosa chinensis]|uniref:Uncharacterized protein n=1 Tax=Rosa chinensis TaxID=74649 RepID=A0A2P6QBS8_ROSCH|nr:hypothetical protein RchiOBHm_Chr5g0037661 [Rosa chinensis]
MISSTGQFIITCECPLEHAKEDKEKNIIESTDPIRASPPVEVGQSILFTAFCLSFPQFRLAGQILFTKNYSSWVNFLTCQLIFCDLL